MVEINFTSTTYLLIVLSVEKGNRGGATGSFCVPTCDCKCQFSGTVFPYENGASWPQIEPFEAGFMQGGVVWIWQNNSPDTPDCQGSLGHKKRWEKTW